MSKREFLDRFEKVWNTVPEWKFEQILCNVFGLECDEDFYADDDFTIKYIEDYFRDYMEDLEKKGK